LVNRWPEADESRVIVVVSDDPNQHQNEQGNEFPVSMPQAVLRAGINIRQRRG
jgi:hypothetical protein